jgi:phosphoglycerate dehydrogenase-like enzyme
MSAGRKNVHLIQPFEFKFKNHKNTKKHKPQNCFHTIGIREYLKMDSRVVGVLGGGQLGRMMVNAGNRLGIRMSVLDPGTTTMYV